MRALALMYHRSRPLSMGQVGVRHPVGCSVYQLADEHRPWPLRTCQSEVIDACTIGPTSAAWLANPTLVGGLDGEAGRHRRESRGCS